MKYYFKTSGKSYVFDGNKVAVFLKGTEIERVNSLRHFLPIDTDVRTDYLKTVCLILNNSCNLCCDYCYAHGGTYNLPPQKMSLRVAKQAIDMTARSVLQHNDNKITIAFFGGEPLLNFNLIQKIVNYVKEYYKNLSAKYQITTNGTLITKSIAKFLERNNFDIMLSIDGNKKLHDFYRKYKNGIGTFDDIIENLHNIKNKKLINARITITNINPNINDYIDDILKLGIRRITFAADYFINSVALKKYVQSLKLLIKKYEKDIKSGYLYDITNLTKVICSIVLHTRYRTHCNAGISYLTVSPEGNYYRCPRFVGNKDFYMGKINKIEEVTRNMENFKNILGRNASNRNSGCAKCHFVNLCGGMCYHHANFLQKDQFAIAPKECLQRKTIYKWVLRLICNLSVTERRNLLHFLMGLWKNFTEEDYGGN